MVSHIRKELLHSHSGCLRIYKGTYNLKVGLFSLQIYFLVYSNKIV